MSCPYFEIQKSEDFDNAAEIIQADKEVKHFVRQRRYAPFDVSDNSIKSAFDKNIRHSQSVYFKALCLFSVVFSIMIAISIYIMIAALPEERVRLIAIPLTALGIGILFRIFLFCHLKEFTFINTCDNLFIAYDSEGNFYSVEISKKRIRVLHKAVLDLGKYLDSSDKYMKPVLVPQIKYSSDGNCTLSIGERGPSQRRGKHSKTHVRPLLQHLHFCKYLFTVNNELKLISVYSAARENAVINFDALTFATVAESGNSAIESLREIAHTNSRLEKTLKQIDNSF